jgi:broad specificity phosphatase PhoE
MMRRRQPGRHGDPRGRAILVRHAATSWSGVRYSGRSDPWLSSAGRAQAAALAAEIAAELRPGSTVRIVSSPARRARQTARAIEAALTGRGEVRLTSGVRVDARWAEVDVGQVDGWTFAHIERRLPALAAVLAAGDPAVDWPAGEMAAALGRRVSAAWADVVAEPAETVIVVSHAGPLRLAVAAAEGRDPREVPFAEVAARRHVLRSDT